MNLDPKRMDAIVKRQDPPRYGPQYQASIRATRQEAPSRSRAAIVYSSRYGRGIHLLSRAEQWAAALASYHPKIVELQEQRMLHCWPAPHPAAGLDPVMGVSLPPLRGTVDVAERLGALSIHPWVTVPDPVDPHITHRRAYPYIGDLLLYLRDDSGAIYSVNWTVKRLAAAFDAPFGDRFASAKRRYNTDLRHRIEEIYYADAGIRTVRVVGEEIDRQLAANLWYLWVRAERPCALSEAAQQMIVDALAYGMGQHSAPISTISILSTTRGWDPQACMSVMYRAIWRRELRVDLYAPILPDYPLIPERRDVLVDYAHWFAP